MIQLALPGTGPRAFVEDLANNTDFSGLLIVGVTPTAFFRTGPGLMGGAIDYAQTETPAQRFGHRLFLFLARTFGFLDADYTLIKLLRNHRYIEREGVEGPYRGGVEDLGPGPATTDLAVVTDRNRRVSAATRAAGLG